MSAVLEETRTRIVSFDASMADQVLDLAHEMHEESVSHRYAPMDEVKLLKQLSAPLTNPDVYLKFAVRGNEVLGGFFGSVSTMFFSDAKAAKDLAWFVKKSRRGSYAAVLLVRDFEAWARTRGARLIFLGQSTGVNQETTKMLYESLGYSMIGVNTVKVV